MPIKFEIQRRCSKSKQLYHVLQQQRLFQTTFRKLPRRNWGMQFPTKELSLFENFPAVIPQVISKNLSLKRHQKIRHPTGYLPVNKPWETRLCTVYQPSNTCSKTNLICKRKTKMGFSILSLKSKIFLSLHNLWHLQFAFCTSFTPVKNRHKMLLFHATPMLL